MELPYQTALTKWRPIRELPGSNGLQRTPVSAYPEQQDHHRSDEQIQCRHSEHTCETEPWEDRSYENRRTKGAQPAHCRCQTNSRRTDACRKDLGSVRIHACVDPVHEEG